ncbi:MAG: tetraacyldisaccharide 4'-kinase [Flavobacteriales bacterium]|nr:tetraacyldisaccharide 4'-kinase [Flavobacteriales bacterium]
MLVTEMRNFFYRSGILKSSQFDIPIISIGNLSVGGTGKSPMTAYLVNRLKSNHQVGVLSRGYGRKTQGYLEVDSNGSATEYGDEPLQLKRNFPDIPVAVESHRIKGIVNLLDHHEEMDVVLLDDAYQHRAVKAGLSILLTDYSAPFFTDFVLPTGNLRELRSNANRADIIIVTKCPEYMDQSFKKDFIRKISKYSKAPVFFSSVVYENLCALNQGDNVPALDDKYVLALSGIARPVPFFTFLKSKSKCVKEMRFPDHHRFTLKDIQKIEQAFHEFSAQGGIICTTEKDAMRLQSLQGEAKIIIQKLPIFYQKIGVKIHEESLFNSIIEEYVATNKGNHLIPSEQDESHS